MVFVARIKAKHFDFIPNFLALVGWRWWFCSQDCVKPASDGLENDNLQNPTQNGPSSLQNPPVRSNFSGHSSVVVNMADLYNMKISTPGTANMNAQ